MSSRAIQPKADYKEKLRFNWNAPIAASPTQKGVVYIGAQFLFRSTDHGDTWQRISPDLTTNDPEKQKQEESGGITVDNSSAESNTTISVINEDTVRRDLLFLGTEFGLFISPDSGAQWAEFRGGDFPRVAVRDLVVHPREGDLVLATHGRGIWIIDDLSPLRALSAGIMAQDVAFLPDRPAQERMPAGGGWSEGDATFTGENPPGGAVVTYYQRARHLYGPIELEIVGSDGKAVDTIPASTRRGLNRVTWSMQLKPPRVPRAATVSNTGSRGPRVLPGTYTVRLLKPGKTLEVKLEIGLDRRATYSVEDRRRNFEAAMQVVALFGDMSTVVDKLDAAQKATAERTGRLPKGDPLAARLAALRDKLEEVRRKIVTTKEGGAITGEERIREHADHLYGALL